MDYIGRIPWKDMLPNTMQLPRPIAVLRVQLKCHSTQSLLVHQPSIDSDG